MLTELLIAISSLAGLALWLLIRYGSRRAKADRLFIEMEKTKEDLRYVTAKLAIAIKTGDITVRDKLDIKRVQLQRKLANLRREYARYK